jgi:hypothetical protein
VTESCAALSESGLEACDEWSCLSFFCLSVSFLQSVTSLHLNFDVTGGEF